jgi:hypothetical protein
LDRLGSPLRQYFRHFESTLVSSCFFNFIVETINLLASVAYVDIPWSVALQCLHVISLPVYVCLLIFHCCIIFIFTGVDDMILVENVSYIICVKVNLSLYLTKHHAMKTYWGSGRKAPRIL